MHGEECAVRVRKAVPNDNVYTCSSSWFLHCLISVLKGRVSYEQHVRGVVKLSKPE